jgi:UDP-N-acetylglucosamine:LPS N-acetylglucosamine transferase
VSSPGLRLALAGGGTGGHLVPGLALLDHLVAGKGPAPLDLLWFQSGRAVEERVLEGLEDRMAPTPVARVRLALEPPGGGAPSTLRTLMHLMPAVLRARRALRAHQSDVLLGLGGFTSAPAALAAKSLGIPFALLEINATSGRATRLLSPLAKKVFHATQATCPQSKSSRHLVTGAPVSPSFRRRTEEDLSARRALGFDPAQPLLVVLGGSQGAGGLNQFLAKYDHEFAAAGISVFHAVGPGRQSEAPAGRTGLVVTEFAREVPTLLAAATLVLCRGGASTLAEVMAVGTPAMVVPYPHHTDRHQERNAALLGDGCRIVQEEDLDRSLFEELCLLMGDQGKLRLENMSGALRTAGGPPAAEQILAAILSSLE